MTAPERREVSPIGGLRVLLLDGFTRQVMPMAKALRRAGVHVTTLNASRLDVGYVSRWPHARRLGPHPLQQPAQLLEAVRQLLATGHYDVVIPLVDVTADMLAEHKAELAPLAAVAVNDWPVYERGRDKLLTMRACAQLGLPHPRTFDAAAADVEAAVRAAGLQVPLVVKPRLGYGAMGFRRVDRWDELQPTIRAVSERFGPSLVQEYIPQDDLQYKAELVVDAAGAVKSCVVFSKIRWFPLQGGSSTLNATVLRPDIDATCVSLLQGLGWRGYADVDLIQDPRDGIAKVMEINPRITGSVRICFDAGVDFARQVVEDARGLPVTPYPAYTVGRYLRYMHTDILWLMLSPDRWRAKPSWFDFRRTTDQIFSMNDPLPALAYSLQGLSKLARWRRKRRLDVKTH